MRPVQYRRLGDFQMRCIVICCCMLLLFVGIPATAQVFSSKSDRAVFLQQTRVLDKRAKRYGKAVRPYQDHPDHVSLKRPGYTGQYRGPYVTMAREAALRNGVPEDLFLRLVQRESNWNASARSPKGALGLAQLMPATARELNVDPLDPYQNLDGGARYLARQYRTFGSWRLAVAAYNAGPGAVVKYGDVPPYKETRNYVRAILGS